MTALFRRKRGETGGATDAAAGETDNPLSEKGTTAEDGDGTTIAGEEAAADTTSLAGPTEKKLQVSSGNGGGTTTGATVQPVRQRHVQERAVFEPVLHT